MEDATHWWERVQSKLQLLLLGIDPVRYGLFEALGPVVDVISGGERDFYTSVEDPIIHTAEAADFCLTFVLDTTVRLQEVERIRQPHGRYKIRTNCDCEYFDARAASGGSVGRLPKGTLIEGAHIGEGPWREGDSAAWFWDDLGTKQTFLIPLADASVETYVPRFDYENEMRERLDAIRASRDGKGGGQ